MELPKKERVLEMKKVVWIDDCSDKWESLEDWRELHVCPFQSCLSCPLSVKNNGMNVLCDRLVKDFPERVLTLMQGKLCRVGIEEKEKRGEKIEKMKDEEEVVWIENVKSGERKKVERGYVPMILLCGDSVCSGCPVWRKTEQAGLGCCIDWMKEHWEEGLGLLGWRMVEEKKEDGEQREDGEQKMEKMKIRHKESGQTVEINPEDVLATQLCFRENCMSCPLDGYDCTEWVSEHLDEALKIFGFEKVGDAKLEEVKKEEIEQETCENEICENNYFLMRHLGVGYRERFQVEGTDGVYYVGVAGRLFRVYDRDGSRKREIEDGQVLYTLLEHPERVRKGLTAEHREYLEAVLKVLPEVRWVKRDGDWLLFGKKNVVLLTRVGEEWEELGKGEKRYVRELLGE